MKENTKFQFTLSNAFSASKETIVVSRFLIIVDQLNNFSSVVDKFYSIRVYYIKRN